MAEARYQLQKLTECCICFKTFTDPRMLPCIHTFCLECLKGTCKAANKNPGENVPCPLCRKLFVIPTEDMNSLQRNFFMQHLIDVTTTLQEGQKSVTDCDICKVLHEEDEEYFKEATKRCLECGDNFCDMCARTHKLHKSSKTHSIMKIGSETEEDIRKMQTTRNCAVHNQQPLSFYCADCTKVICVSCFVENHASHKCKDVTSVEKEFRKTIKMHAAKISNFAEEMLSRGRKAEQRTTEVILNLAETEEKIRKRNLDLKKMIDSHTNALLDQLSLIKQRHFKDIAVEEEEIERSHAILNSFQTYCTELSSKGSPCDVCDCVDEMVARANELGKDHEAFIGRPYKKTEVFFTATNLGELLSTSRGNIVGQIQDDKLQQGLEHAGGNNYFNAMIQCLCQTCPLLEVFCSTTNLEQPLTKAFVTFMNHNYLGLSGQKDACSKFFEQVYKLSPKLSNFRQHESHDLFIQFLNNLRSEEIRSGVQGSRFNVDSKEVLSTIDKVFGGHFITICSCLNCNRLNFECEPFLDITLPISIPKHQHHQFYSGGRSRRETEMRCTPRLILKASQVNLGHASNRGKGTDLTQVSLQVLNEEQNTPTDDGGRHRTKPVTLSLTECLRFCTTTEHISEGYLCLSCQSGQKAAAKANTQTRPSATKRTLVYNPPAVLVLHMKRFEKTATGFMKLCDRVTYEELLDLGPYCSSDCLRIDPTDKNVWYSLYGVVAHIGSLESGHFFAYVKMSNLKSKATKAFLQKSFLDRDEVARKQMNDFSYGRKTADWKMEWRPIPPNDGKWICVSDADTRDATSHEALNQEAFMLFYERVPK